MHMADPLLSPVVGCTMWVASAGSIAYCSAKVRNELDDRKVPLMGVLGAFLFAAQMINFSIPATGSSGHLGGALLLAILLGPYAALLALASVLVVQALFFADGGLLALGCNIFNMGFIPAFIVYPFIYKKIIGKNRTRMRLTVATMLSAIVGLQLGSFGVVMETLFSGISALPFSTFMLFMQPIHLAIGLVEGFVTVAVVSFVHKARPEILQGALDARPIEKHPVAGVVLAFLVVALVSGGCVSWLASENPDGLEWAITKVTGKKELTGPDQGIHAALAALQKKAAFMPGYSFKKPADATDEGKKPAGEKNTGAGSNLGNSVAGIIGGVMALAITFFIGFILKKRAGTH